MTRSTTTGVVALTLVATALLVGDLTASTSSAAPPEPHGSARHTHRHEQERLTRDWVQLWNGDYRDAHRIIAPDFTVHAALLDGGDGSAIKGPDGLLGMIREIRSVFSTLRFKVQVGPIVDGDQVVVRWRATGTYGGGFPGATAPVGTVIAFEGTDIFRARGGRIHEYWLNADTLGLLTQLQVEGA